MVRHADEWVWGWDSAPGIVSVGWISTAAPLSGAEFWRQNNCSSKRRDSARGWCL